MTDPVARAAPTYRVLTADDLTAAQGLTQRLGWAHRLEDWQFAARLGCGVVAVDPVDPAVLLGTTLYWTYGDTYASIGLVVVSPERQGAGIGRALMAQALAAVAGRHVMLNATAAGRPLYEKLGFGAVGTICQHQGIARPTTLPPPPPGERLRPVVAGDLPAIARLASRASGMPRDAVITELFAVGRGIAIDQDGVLTGVAFVRRFGRGHTIGPVIAPDPARARALIAHWVAQHPGVFLRIDVPAETGLSPWLADLGLTRVDTGTSMVKGTPPQEDPHARLFALVNQALH